MRGPRFFLSAGRMGKLAHYCKFVEQEMTERAQKALTDEERTHCQKKAEEAKLIHDTLQQPVFHPASFTRGVWEIRWRDDVKADV